MIRLTPPATVPAIFWSAETCPAISSQPVETSPSTHKFLGRGGIIRVRQRGSILDKLCRGETHQSESSTEGG